VRRFASHVTPLRLSVRDLTLVPAILALRYVAAVNYIDAVRSADRDLLRATGRAAAGRSHSVAAAAQEARRRLLRRRQERRRRCRPSYLKGHGDKVPNAAKTAGKTLAGCMEGLVAASDRVPPSPWKGAAAVVGCLVGAAGYNGPYD
jgi:hypothetical protein